MEGARMAAGAALMGNGGGPPVQALPVAQGLPGGPTLPVKPPIYVPLARPETAVARGANTFLFMGSIGWVCLNAYWGNPVVIAGCTVIAATWFARVLGVNISQS